MTTRLGAAAAIFILALASTACTGGTEGNAAEEKATAAEAEKAERKIDAHRELNTISPAIPIYHGAHYNADLSKRDEVMVRNQYGQSAKVYTLATDDSFPQVFHYYTTYLGQFRGYQPRDTYPPKQQQWRSLEVPLNQAMQDPFIPGQSLEANKQVILQIAETEAEPKTVIRYVIADALPAAPVPPATAATATAATAPAVSVAR